MAATYGVHPNQVVPWKKPALEVLPDVFSARRGRVAQDDEAWRARLYQQIGPLNVERDWRKKKAGVPACAQAAMGRTAPRAEPCAAAMSVTRSEPITVVLPGGCGACRTSAPEAMAGCARHARPLVWGAAPDRLAAATGLCGQGQAGATRVAAEGMNGRISPTTPEPTGCRGPAVSLCTDRDDDGSVRPRLVDGDHLRETGPGLCVPRGQHGLVEPLCAVVGGVGDLGPPLWRISPGACADPDAAGNLHLRSRGPVHEPGVYRAVVGAWDSHQQGWTWASRR
jgi:hypothetical protein